MPTINQFVRKVVTAHAKTKNQPSFFRRNWVCLRSLPQRQRTELGVAVKIARVRLTNGMEVTTSILVSATTFKKVHCACRAGL